MAERYNSSYLSLAAKVIRLRGRPMSADDILHYAKMFDLLPPHLSGETKHKTLQARIAEEINRYGSLSKFYRTASGRYFLREMSRDPSLPSKSLRELHAAGRTRPVPSAVFCINKQYAASLAAQNHRSLELTLSEGGYFPLDEAPSDMCPVGVFTVVISEGYALSHIGGPYSNFPAGRTIGFRSYVSEDSWDLFSIMPRGIDGVAISNIYRVASLRPDSPRIDEDDLRNHLYSNVCIYDGNLNMYWVSVIAPLDGIGATKLSLRRRLDVSSPKWIEINNNQDVSQDSLSRLVMSKLVR